MKIRVVGGLPYVTVSLVQNGKRLNLDWVVLDTGSESCVFSADELLRMGVVSQPEDRLHRITGVGGVEFVIARKIEKIVLDEMEVHDFEVQIGGLNYGFPLQGILGMDFLLRAGALIDLNRLEISVKK